MPIRPIDLQTLLMKLGQVGRDQAVEKEGALLQSSVQGAASLKRQADSKEAVRGPEEPKEGAGPVGDRSGRGRGEKRGEGEEREEEAPEEPREEIVRDPDLGANVDLSG